MPDCENRGRASSRKNKPTTSLTRNHSTRGRRAFKEKVTHQVRGLLKGENDRWNKREEPGRHLRGKIFRFEMWRGSKLKAGNVK